MGEKIWKIIKSWFSLSWRLVYRASTFEKSSSEISITIWKAQKPRKGNLTIFPAYSKCKRSFYFWPFLVLSLHLLAICRTRWFVHFKIRCLSAYSDEFIRSNSTHVLESGFSYWHQSWQLENHSSKRKFHYKFLNSTLRCVSIWRIHKGEVWYSEVPWDSCRPNCMTQSSWFWAWE